MDLRQIQYFMCLYEEESVTRAARRLNIVQPALSMQIAKIESEFGRKLFERTAQGMQPTAEARTMYQLLTPVLRDLKNAQQQISNMNGEIAGRVSIGMVTSVSQSVLVDTLAEFTARYPAVETTVNEGYSADLVDWLTSGSLDVAIVNRPQKSGGIILEPIIEEEFVLVSGREKGPKLPAVVRLDRLAGYNLVLPSKRNGLRTIIDRQVEYLGDQFVPKLEVDALPTITDLVAKSEWLSILPRILVYRQLKERVLRAHRLESPRIVRNLVWAHHPRRPMTPAARKLTELICSRLNRAATAKYA